MKVIYSPKQDSLLFKVTNYPKLLRCPKLTLGKEYDVIEVSFDNDL
jgi:hypothetical protein